MNKKNSFKLVMLGLAIFLFTIGCNAPADKKTEMEPIVMAEPAMAEADMVSIKAEIQALETAWATADNAPMSKGKSAIQKEIEEGMAKKAKGETVSYNALEVYGDEDIVTEIGTSIAKDASGKVIRTGKYMAIWEKRDGKYICIRDIYNNDAIVK